MRRQDKLTNMINANKSFQDRVNGKIKETKEEVKITYVPDFYPELSKLIR